MDLSEVAYAASLRSGDPSRQVGAAIIDPYGDLISVGCNGAPKPGGGLYDPPSPGKESLLDIQQKFDSNEREKEIIAERIGREIGGGIDPKAVRTSLKAAGFFDIREFGRAVHAEMEALLACARSGRSARGATLFTTTFPCHNCTRHIIAAGKSKVIYIEPYAESRASALHPDEISVDREEAGKVPFLPFVGVGPRRYLDLFSLMLSAGYPIERKKDGELIPWSRATAVVRLQVKPSTYLQRELLAWGDLKRMLSSHGQPKTDSRGVLGQDGPRDPPRRQGAGVGERQPDQRTPSNRPASRIRAAASATIAARPSRNRNRVVRNARPSIGLLDLQHSFQRPTPPLTTLATSFFARR
jgi:deoxycytidylate deaminase